MYPHLENIPEIIDEYFDNETQFRGMQYSREKRVNQFIVSEQGSLIKAIVSGKGNKKYEVRIQIKPDKYADLSISSTCSCPVTLNCKHAVAALIDAYEKNKKFNFSKLTHNNEVKTTNTQEEARIKQWLNTFSIERKHDDIPEKPKDNFHLHYILKNPLYKKTLLHVEFKLARVLKNGGYGKSKNYDPNSFSQEKFLTESDHMNLTHVKLMNNGSTLSYYQTHKIDGKSSSNYLKEIISTNRCHFHDTENPVITMGEPKSVIMRWQLLQNGNQSIHSFIENKPTVIFILDEPWYFDAEKNMLGIAKINLPVDLIEKLLSAPEVPPELIPTVSQQIKSLLPNNTDLAPLAVAAPEVIKNCTPIPVIQLSIENIKSHQYPFPINEKAIAQLFFDYEPYFTVPFSFQNPEKIIKFAKDDCIYILHRNFDIEKKYLLELSDHINLSEYPASTPANQAEKYFVESIKTPEDYITFVTAIIPQLEIKGWRVIRNHPYFNSVLEEEDVAWYSELDESAGYDYFSFKLGIVIDDEKIDILPVVAKIFKNTAADDLKNYKDDQKISLPLGTGKILSVKFSRIKPILNTLIELFDSEVSGKSGLRLSKYQSELLHELEKGFGASQMRWFGGEKLRALGKKIAEFQSISPAKAPRTFKATLRPYQQEGLNWLQFLREYELNGILADDMGLGKTVQTIAHLSIEKSKKRIKKPVLIIAPTSLMFNWKKEIETFSPSLSTIVFHGDDRKQHQETLSNYDVVLTTYPLLSRDKAILLKQPFYYLILDEAQNIKNNQTKSTQIVHQIQAEHRLCLTGTPMENHLGDLWSLFHFLMPGLLGDVKQFNRLYRKPIEKEQDYDRQKLLARRLKPFMLRRKKNEVTLELPEKTEIIRTAELQGPERDLYESIRLSMEKKVRDAIKAQGLNRSHIIILDALLKLRQVCCHPKLVKLTAAKKAHECGSKLQLLQSMLPSMVEEGRKILIFSQFTEMLSIIENLLTAEKLSYVKLTGETKNRAKPISEFQNGNVPIFLISLKAGGTGLNLTAADTVIHYDPWWNPAVEDQATDRAHRIGQQKAVFVYKLLTAGTVEETIQEMQQKKRQLIEGLFSETGSKKGVISADDLQNLFKPLV